MPLKRAKAYVAEHKRDGDVMEFDVSCAAVELAAKAVGCESELIAKTLSFSVGDRMMLVVYAKDARVANPKFKERFALRSKRSDNSGLPFKSNATYRSFA